VAGSDEQEVDRHTGRYDGESDEAFECVVDERNQHETQHYHDEEDWQQKIHLKPSKAMLKKKHKESKPLYPPECATMKIIEIQKC